MPAFLRGDGEMAAAIRGHDWRDSLGAPAQWPAPLATLVGLLLSSEQPMFMAWGPQRTWLYNDAFVPILGRKHPEALGRPALDVWSEARHDLAPLFDRVFQGQPVHMKDITLGLDRRGQVEEAHFSFSRTRRCATPTATSRGCSAPASRPPTRCWPTGAALPHRRGSDACSSGRRASSPS